MPISLAKPASMTMPNLFETSLNNSIAPARRTNANNPFNIGNINLANMFTNQDSLAPHQNYYDNTTNNMTAMQDMNSRNLLSRPHSVFSNLNNNQNFAAAPLPRESSVISAFKQFAGPRRSTRIESKQQDQSAHTIRKADSIVHMGRRGSSIHSVTSTRKREYKQQAKVEETV